MKKFIPLIIFITFFMGQNGLSQCISKRAMEQCLNKVPGGFKELNPVYSFRKVDSLNKVVCDTVLSPQMGCYYPYCDFSLNNKQDVTSYVRSIHCTADTCVLQPFYMEIYKYNTDGTMASLIKLDRPNGNWRGNSGDSVVSFFKYQNNRPIEREEDSYNYGLDDTRKKIKRTLTKTMYKYVYNSERLMDEHMESQSAPVEVK
jgi:hypothetical protein